MLFLKEGFWISEYVSWSNPVSSNWAFFIIHFPETEMISWEIEVAESETFLDFIASKFFCKNIIMYKMYKVQYYLWIIVIPKFSNPIKQPLNI